MKSVRVRKKRNTKSRHRNRKKVDKAMKMRSHHWTTSFFVIAVIALTLYFLKGFSTSLSVTDPSILMAAPHAVPMQYLLLIISLVVFVSLSLSWFKNKLTSEWDIWLFGTAWISLAVYYILAFQPQIAPNGDNAEYIINAKSLVEHGRALRLDTPTDTPNTLASLGLPALLAPIYAIWGMDLVKMKALIMILGIGIFPVFYLFLKEHFSRRMALLVTFVALGNPYVLGSSTTIMTETPYILFSLLGLLICHRYHQSSDFSWKWGLLSLLIVGVVYQMRIVGLALGAALGVALAVSAIKEFIAARSSKSGFKEFLRSPTIKKLLLIGVPALVGLIALQIWQGKVGTSQAEVFFKTDFLNDAWRKVKSVYLLIGPTLCSGETFLWMSFAADAKPPNLHLGWFLAAIPAWVGLGRSLYKNQVIGFYVLFILLLIVFGSRTAQVMVIIRYLTILIPLFILFYVLGLQFLIKHFWPKRHRSKIGKWPKVACCLLLAQMLLINAGSNAYAIARGNVGYGKRYTDLIMAAAWAGVNLPEDALVASVKPRIFYLYSGLNGVRLLNIGSDKSKVDPEKIVERWANEGVTHVVIDQLSGSSRTIAGPIVASVPDLFEKIATPTTDGSTTIYKLQLDPDL